MRHVLVCRTARRRGGLGFRAASWAAIFPAAFFLTAGAQDAPDQGQSKPPGETTSDIVAAEDLGAKKLFARFMAYYRDQHWRARYGAEVSYPTLAPPLTPAHVRSFAEGVTMLNPKLPPSPASHWSRLIVRANRRLMAIDAQSGDTLWEASMPLADHMELLIDTRRLTILADRHRITALHGDTGRKAWSVGHTPSGVNDPDSDPEDFAVLTAHAYQGDHLFSMRDDDRAACIDVRTGQPLWQRRLGNPFDGALAVSGRWLLYTSRHLDSRLICALDARTGQRAFTLDWQHASAVSKLLVSPDGRLVTVSPQVVRCHDLDTQAMLWQRSFPDLIAGASVVMDLDALYLSDRPQRICKLSLVDGRTLWESESVPNAGHGVAVAGLFPDMLITFDVRYLAALDLVTGRVLRRRQLDHPHSFREFSVTSRGIVTIDAPRPDQVGAYAAHFFAHTDCHAGAPDFQLQELGSFTDVKGLTIRNNALALQSGRTIHFWSSQHDSALR